MEDGYLADAYRLALQDAQVYKTAHDLIHGKGVDNLTEQELEFARTAVRMAMAYLPEET